jgi:hypothetical protein
MVFLNAGVPRPQLSYPAKAGYPVRRGFSDQSPESLEYWIARSSQAMTAESAAPSCEEPTGRSRDPLALPTPCPPNQNIENNPMQSRRRVLEALNSAKNILTRRANHRHYCIIAPFAKPVRHPGSIRHQPVGWVEPTGRANARPMTGSAIPITSSASPCEHGRRIDERPEVGEQGDGFRKGSTHPTGSA